VSLLSICTIDGILLDVNNATLRAIGLPIEAFVGKHVWESPWFAMNPEEAARIELEITLHRGQYVEYESSVLSRTGEWRKIQFILRPYRSYIGTEARFVILEVRDVTRPGDKDAGRAPLQPTAKLDRPLTDLEPQD
jgi:PAS domain S-box-containing protein